MNILDYVKNPCIIPPSLLKAELNCELKSISENINVDNIKKELNQILNEKNFLIHKGNHSRVGSNWTYYIWWCQQ